jgi:hypothetical protein
MIMQVEVEGDVTGDTGNPSPRFGHCSPLCVARLLTSPVEFPVDVMVNLCGPFVFGVWWLHHCARSGEKPKDARLWTEGYKIEGRCANVCPSSVKIITVRLT